MHYTQTIPLPLAEKLKEKGMPITITEDIVDFCTDKEHEELTTNCIYAEVFDWLMEKKDTEISFGHHFQSATIAGTMETSHEYYAAHISRQSGGFICYEFGETWHEAANAAIEKALELIKEK